MLSLDPDKPIATCRCETCDECPVGQTLHCHFRPRDLFHFLLIAFPSFLLGGAGIYHMSGWLLVPWLVIIVAYFGFVEIRVMCSHCPHYAEPGSSLKCWANYGAPKLWKYRPGPMTLVEKIVFFGGFVIIWGYPLFFLIMLFQLFLLVTYSITVAGFFMTLKRFFCSQCMNFACPLNGVEDLSREQFLRRNPEA
ncbi:MAG: hypothetical protein WAL98_03135 [Desulfatiglandaceae bacterium]|jgi:hypothetical protein